MITLESKVTTTKLRKLFVRQANLKAELKIVGMQIARLSGLDACDPRYAPLKEKLLGKK